MVESKVVKKAFYFTGQIQLFIIFISILYCLKKNQYSFQNSSFSWSMFEINGFHEKVPNVPKKCYGFYFFFRVSCVLKAIKIVGSIFIPMKNIVT